MKKLFALLFLFNFLLSYAQEFDKSGNAIILSNEFNAKFYLNIFNNSDKCGEILVYTKLIKTELAENIWKFNKTDDGYYYIMNVFNGLYLEPQTFPATNGSKIIQQTPKGGDRQKWSVIPGTGVFYEGYYYENYYILPMTNKNLYISIKGANVVLSDYMEGNSKKAQLWDIFWECFPASSTILT